MCQNVNEIKFCSCSPEQLSSTGVVWSLEKFHSSPRFRTVMGRLAMPDKELNEKLSTAAIEDLLNKNLAFDFEYKPGDGDRFRVIDQDNNTWIQFRYHKKTGLWTQGSLGKIGDEYRDVKTGTIQIQ